MHVHYCRTQVHYWKDYNFNTTIPNDAIRGGTDTKGYPTYIGQFPISNPHRIAADVVSGIIDRNLTFSYGVHNSEVTVSFENNKILCTTSARFFWSTTFIPNCQLVEGGSNYSQPLYIGRANHKGQNITGSFSMDDSILRVPVFEEAKANIREYVSFEILQYCS